MSLADFEEFFRWFQERAYFGLSQAGFGLIPDDWAFQIFILDGSEFRPFFQRGYHQSDYRYKFLTSNPESWISVFETGSLRLGSEFEGHSLWMFVDKIQKPEAVILIEVPDQFSDNLEFLRLLVLPILLTLSYDRSQLPNWIDRMLPPLLKTSSPLLLVSEEGSGREHLVSFLNRYRFSNDLAWFRPGNLTEAIQLREFFGDAAGERLRSSESVPIVDLSKFIAVEEVSNLSPIVQSRLVTILNQKNDRFWIFESSKDLSGMVSAGQFNSDLYNLLKQNQVLVQPLRLQSNQDLVIEAERFLLGLFQKHHREVKLSTEAAALLFQYEWPGNLDEFYKTLEAAYFLSRSDSIRADDLHFGLWYRTEANDLDLREQTEDLERKLLLKAYSLHGGNQVHMARSLGISRGSLQYRWVRLGLQESS